MDCVDDHGWTTMHETILGKSIEVAEYLNKIRPKMKFKACQQGRTSLHLAAFCDSPKALLRYIIRMIKHHQVTNDVFDKHSRLNSNLLSNLAPNAEECN